MKKYLFILIFSVISYLSFGQSSKLSITEIDSIAKRIDTTCISAGITDYTLKSMNKKTRKTINGGGADWYYTDTTGKLIKVIREIILDTENFDTYYFYNDTLIYLKITNVTYNGNNKIVNCSQECYFQGDKLVLRQDNLKISFSPKNYIETAREFFVGNQLWKKEF